MKKLIIALLLLGGVGLGAWFLFRPNPARELAQIEEAFKKMEGQMQILASRANNDPLPPVLQGSIDLINQYTQVLAGRKGDCAGTAAALLTINQDFLARAGSYQNGMSALANMARTDRAGLERAVANMLNRLVPAFRQMLPHLREFASSCPREFKAIKDILTKATATN